MGVAKEACYLLFYAIYRADPFGHGRAYNEFKALVGVTMTQFLVIAIADFWIMMKGGGAWFFGLPKGAILVIGVGLSALNYWVFLRRGRWRTYARQFDGYSRRGKIVRFAAVAMFIVAVLLLMACTLYAVAVAAQLRRA